MTIEKLTKHCRTWLLHDGHDKALRIIDAHEAERAELVARAEAADLNAQHCAACVVQAESVADEAESEAEALRAELAEARALLAEVSPPRRDWTGRYLRWLTANPVSPRADGGCGVGPTGGYRAAAERAVLDVVRRWVDGEVTSVAHIASAEHALRAVKP